VSVIDYFDIHGLVTIKVIQPRGATRFLHGLRALDYFKVPDISTPPDIIVETGEFTPDLAGCDLVDQRYYIRPNYFFCADCFKGASWKVQIEGFEEGQTHIHLKIKNRGIGEFLFADYFYHALFLKQFIASHLRRKGYFLASGAAVSNGGKAIVLLGRGGAYKTALLMEFLRRNPAWQFLGDDLIILGNGNVYSFPTYPWIFQFRKKAMKTEAFGLFSRLGALFYFTNTDKLDLDIVDQSRIHLLMGCNIALQDDITLRKANQEDITQQLDFSAQIEDASDWNMGFTDAFTRYVEAYKYVFPINRQSRLRDDPTPPNIIGTNVPKVYQLYLPLRDVHRKISNAVDLINDKFLE